MYFIVKNNMSTLISTNLPFHKCILNCISFKKVTHMAWGQINPFYVILSLFSLPEFLDKYK